jgi:quercetin dioxygenase-like cupin family protein
MINYSFKLTVPQRGAVVSPEENRQKILNLEAAMFQAAAEGSLEPLDFPLKHHHADGSYGREMFIAKGRVIVGKIHKHSHVNVISQGKVSVMTEDGLQILTAPLTFVSKPGTKRVVYAHEDTIWTTIHVTEETDLEKIEEQVIAKSFDEYFALTSPEQSPLQIQGEKL